MAERGRKKVFLNNHELLIERLNKNKHILDAIIYLISKLACVSVYLPTSLLFVRWFYDCNREFLRLFSKRLLTSWKILNKIQINNF